MSRFCCLAPATVLIACAAFSQSGCTAQGLDVHVKWSLNMRQQCIESGEGNISLDTPLSWMQLVSELRTGSDLDIKGTTPKIDFSISGCEPSGELKGEDIEIWGNTESYSRTGSTLWKNLVLMISTADALVGTKAWNASDSEITADAYCLNCYAGYSVGDPTGTIRITPVAAETNIPTTNVSSPPQQGYAPPQNPPPATATSKPFDQLLDSVGAASPGSAQSPFDNLLNGISPISTGPPGKQTRLTYVSFANHNGLTSDGTWGVGISTNNPNEADGLAMSSCNTKIAGGPPQCSSDATCTLQTGQWAAHAVSTVPFMTSDGPYLTATACGLPTRAAAQAQALQSCQANAGGTNQCAIVWAGRGQ